MSSFTIHYPSPSRRKITEELNFQRSDTPSCISAQFGSRDCLHGDSNPRPCCAQHLALSIPLFGKAEVSSLMKSNLYDAEASFSAGKDVVETPSYSAKFDVKGTSPIDVLSIKIEESKLSVKGDAIVLALGMKIRNQAEASAECK
ncbi:unnamed protein product [Pleuronectes platessa]|uniref:Uncharacterized protein n=1 Tax=Pleuronectes platessa TaxID=8262 RepID=A0A9N7YTP5_PLEPL|nr:unnamed protein product [Pleuronectes platessa]